MSPARERIAAIDVGSNTVLFTVAEHDPDSGLVVIEEGEDQPRLGAGLSASGRLSAESMERALLVLARIRETCRRLGVTRLAAVATAAVREAENSAEFVQRVRAMEIPLRTISAETEAGLAYRSAAHHFPAGGSTLVADIGGGSVELIGAVDGRITLSRSLPLGAVRLTERSVSLPELRGYIRVELEQVALPAGRTGCLVIGSGGTFATIASMALARRGLSSAAVHGTVVPTPEVEQLLGDLAAMSQQQRRQVPGLRPERADIIVAGLAVACELLDCVGAEALTISGFGLRDGLLLEMVGAAS